MTSREIRCCCDRIDCAFLARTYRIIDDLEHDMREAGKLGQALLRRYEKHVESFETEKGELISAMEKLENDKLSIEISNAQIIEENRSLLDQLEELNQAVAGSDIHINSLNFTLDTTRQELTKLSGLAKRATQLERELTELELERVNLDSQLVICQEEKQLITQRWKKAEIIISNMQDQIESMDKEAREERSKHQDILLRMKQRGHSVSLNSRSSEAVASGATHYIRKDGTQGGAVTHFVKDILQDNSNLQLGILELREMLSASSGEIKKLRAQIDLQSPIQHESGLPSYSLNAEISTDASLNHALETVPEMHVHHHYYQQSRVIRKPRKCRSVTPSGFVHRIPKTIFPMNSHNAESRVQEYASSTTSKAPAKTTSDIFTGHHSKSSIHSVASESSYAPSTMSGSPYQRSSVFDSFDTAFDTDLITPASSVPGSPIIANVLADFRSLDNVVDNEITVNYPPEASQDLQDLEPERCSETFEKGATSEALHQLPSTCRCLGSSAKSIRHSGSHGRLLSISGMDIHSTEEQRNFMNLKSPPLATPVMPLSAYSVATSTETTASFSSRSETEKHQDSFRHLLEHHVQVFRRGKGQVSSKKKEGLTMKNLLVYSSQPSYHGLPTQVNEDIANDEIKFQAIFRSPGINQPGPIWGMPRPRPITISTQPVDVNVILLRESLQDENVFENSAN